MSTSILGICMLGKVVSVLFYGLGWLASKKSSIPDVVDESKENLKTTGNGIPQTSEVKS